MEGLYDIFGCQMFLEKNQVEYSFSKQWKFEEGTSKKGKIQHKPKTLMLLFCVKNNFISKQCSLAVKGPFIPNF